MKFRIAALLCAGLLLSGCSDLNMGDLLSFGSSDQDAAPPAQPVVAAAAPAVPNDGFCRSVATQDATSNGFDAATQARMAQKSYAQCQTLFGGN